MYSLIIVHVCCVSPMHISPLTRETEISCAPCPPLHVRSLCMCVPRAAPAIPAPAALLLLRLALSPDGVLGGSVPDRRADKKIKG